MKKKYLTAPVIAALIGVGLAGVAKAHLNARVNNPDEEYTFIYSPDNPLDYSQASVEDLSNWHYTENPTTCSGDAKACSITAPATDVDATGTDPILKSNINLQTDGSGNVYYVSDVEPLASYSNQD
ncbi:hypothetical protein GCM10027566_19670 [Arachidicoccus ginsenosidivorans]|uniref:Uncharacterized protein n=1 Tax=Arachidicoccus ginsenosidivorans TaxID=496057 RepID=A0A5B8VMB6_9BACT|nr:hypothetical protein [Arachidicoccus ginsenosidivorans]QEC72231.1 hypothetical protein FSB73_11660 [Arachidicoccus ginsenosidivorans]